MISWIQKTFQNHFRLVFGLLLAITVIPMIFVYSASSGIGHAGQKIAQRPFFGYNLGSSEDSQRIAADTNLSVYLHSYSVTDNEQLQNYGLARIAGLAVADQLHLPSPTEDELKNFIPTLEAFQGQNGQFDPQRYAAFRDQLSTNPQIHEGDVSRVIAEDFRCEQARKLLGGPGYVLPGEVKMRLTRTDSTWTIGVATIDYAAYAPAISAREDELAKFFGDNSFRYEVAPRASVDYVEFKAAAYLGAVTVSDADIQAYYQANKERFPKPAATAKKDEPKPVISLATPTAKPAGGTDAAADFAAVRPQVEAALRHDLAQKLAAKAASDFTLAIYEQKLSANSPALADFLAAQKLTRQSLAPVARDEAPAGTNWPASVSNEAFKLGDQRFFSDPLTVSGGDSVVLFWKETLPSYQPTLTQVHDKVLADYKENEKRKRFIEAGRALHSAITAALRSGTAFDQAVAAAATAQGVKVDAKTYPAFTRRKPPQELDNSVLGTLDRIDKGQVSDMVVGQDKGFIVYAQDKRLPPLTGDNPQFAEATNQLMQTSVRVSQNLYLSELVNAELAKSAPAVAK